METTTKWIFLIKKENPDWFLQYIHKCLILVSRIRKSCLESGPVSIASILSRRNWLLSNGILGGQIILIYNSKLDFPNVLFTVLYRVIGTTYSIPCRAKLNITSIIKLEKHRYGTFKKNSWSIIIIMYLDFLKFT